MGDLLPLDQGPGQARGLRQAGAGRHHGIRRKYLARGAPTATFEAGLKQRIVITEFPSVEKAIAAHESPAYQAAVKVLGDGAERDVRIVEGLE